MAESKQNRRAKKLRVFMVIFAVIIMLAGLSVVALRQVYNSNLLPVSSSEAVVVVQIPKGATTHEIAELLEVKGVVKKAWAFEWYVRNTGSREKLMAGTYALTPSLGVEKVVSAIVKGEVATNLITIVPGLRLEQIRKTFLEAGFSEKDVDVALQADSYKDHPALVDKPLDASLEGYIYPETFQITADTTPSEIVGLSLDELQAHLTPQLRAAIVGQGLTVHQGVTLASIVEKEAGSADNEQAQIAQVFFTRLNQGIELGADATTRYATKNFSEPLTQQQLNSSSPYNTRKVAGLPPGPIGNFTVAALEAVAKPASGEFLFFVTGDDGITRFSRTIDEHEELIQKYGVSGE